MPRYHYYNQNFFHVCGKYSKAPYLVAPIVQSEQLNLVKDKYPEILSGACYGLVSSMANPHTSPYLNQPAPSITITDEVYHAQKNQQNQRLDQNLIKKTLISRRHYCPNHQQQAKELLNFAKNNPSTHLLLSLGKIGYKAPAHATYLRYERNQTKQPEIWYMDPNFGAIKLSSEEEFIEFYSGYYRGFPNPYSTYQIQTMDYAPDDKTLPGVSLTQAYYNLLTGTRYVTHARLIEKIGSLFASVLIGLLYTSPMLFFVNVSPILFIPFALSLLALELTIVFSGCRGILGPVQFFKCLCDTLFDSMMSLFDSLNAPRIEKIDTETPVFGL